MEGQNHPEFAERFEPGEHHDELDRDCRESEEVRAGESGVIRVPETGADEDSQHRRTKNTGPRLLRAENEKLDEPRHRTPRRRAREQPVGEVVEPLLDRRESRGIRHGVTVAAAT